MSGPRLAIIIAVIIIITIIVIIIIIIVITQQQQQQQENHLYPWLCRAMDVRKSSVIDPYWK